ncbi:fimbrial biogenesis chaperone [Halomonas salifodinae]|uniref:fimbrial biogenesis chaperone n=1 Tax=Halomonas salifodinae TaxID=438745 RepID=UPI0033A33B98
MRRYLIALGVLLVSLGWGGVTWAGIVIGGTRVIYPADQREVTVQLSNNGELPSLVQAWVDTGNPEASPEDSEAPFVIFPPIARVEPGSGQVLRLVFGGDRGLAEDRESLFWLNVLDVPPSPQRSEGDPVNFMQLAFRSRIKLFYRPPGLEGHADRAPAQLRWSLSRDPQGQPVLVGENPTPFYVNLSHLGLQGRSLEIGDGQLPPYGEVTFPLPGGVSRDVSRGEFTFINDYGGRVTRDFSL